jgi:Ca-activated chloride channel family protein
VSFIAPEMLWALLALPAAGLAYVHTFRRRSACISKYPGLRLTRSAPQHAGRRHLPFALLGLALAAIGIALGRPIASLTLPTSFDTVLLAVDVSGSMAATDVAPTRLGAAQEAARTFVAEQPADTRIGLVAFGDKAGILQQPTHSRAEMRAAIERLRLRSGTAVGGGIIAALSVIFPHERVTTAPARTPVAPGSMSAAAIILLSDGDSTSGPDLMEAARAAADRGVRVFTVGIGTTEGEVLVYEGWRTRAHLEEETLREVARITGGHYFQAESAGELKRIYRMLTTTRRIETRETELTALLAALAAVLAVFSAGVSLLWFDRVF